MPKPSQYFIDKSEAIGISNSLKEHISDQDTLMKQVRSQSFVSKRLYNLASDTVISNPYGNDLVVSEVKQQLSKYKTNYFYQKPEDVPPEIVKADQYINRHQKAFQITDNFAKDLAKLGGPQEPPEIHLGEVYIAHKREAILFNDQIELKSTQFELPKIYNFDYSKDPNAFVEDKQTDELNEISEKQKSFNDKFLLDARVPLRIIYIEEFQEQVKKNQSLAESRADIPSNLNSVTRTGKAPLNATNSNTAQQARYGQLDHSDFAVNSSFLSKTSERMLATVYQISNHKYFVEGKCQCACHIYANEGKRICNVCLCKLQSDDETLAGISYNFYSNNLLKNTNLPLYVMKNQENNILMTDGRLTRGQVLNLIRQEFEQMGPDQRILHVAKQYQLLADKVWSPKLRSDVAPKIKVGELENLITQAHIEAQNSKVVSTDHFTTAGNIEISKMHAAEASRLMVTSAATQVKVARKSIQSANDELYKKLARQVDEKQLLDLRKTHKSGVEKIVQESITKSSASPERGYHFYQAPVCSEKPRNSEADKAVRKRGYSPKQNTASSNHYASCLPANLAMDREEKDFFDAYEDELENNNEKQSSAGSIPVKPQCGDCSTDQQVYPSTGAARSEIDISSFSKRCISDRYSDELGYDSAYNMSTNDFSSNQQSSHRQVPAASNSPVQLHRDLPPYLPNARVMSPQPSKQQREPKYMQPRTIERVSNVKQNQEIDHRRVRDRERMRDLIADPSMPQMNQKYYQKIINKAYDRLEDLNEYVEFKIMYCKEPINFNDYTRLRKKHVKSNLK